METIFFPVSSRQQVTRPVSRINGEKESARLNSPERSQSRAGRSAARTKATAVLPSRACSLKATSVCPWRRPSRHAVGTNGFLIGVSRPRAVPFVVTGRKQTTADAVQKSQFALAQNSGTNARE